MLTMELSNHALERAGQRNIQLADITFVMTYGQRFYTGEAIQYFLGRRDIPEQYHSDDRFMKLEGTTLITAHDGTLITGMQEPPPEVQMASSVPPSGVIHRRRN